MHRITPTVAAVVAGIFALLLVIYVFAGGKSRGGDVDRLDDSQIAGTAQHSPSTRCSSQKTHDLIKSELFRQAADLRGDDATTFSNVASYSFLRVTEPRVIGQKEETNVIACAGSLVLDLPPGLSVAGGRRSLAGDVAYAIRPATGAGSDVVTISSADAIITPLATLSRADGNTNQQLASAAPAQKPQPTPAPVVAPDPQADQRPINKERVSRPASPTPARAAATPPRQQAVRPRPPSPRPVPIATAPRVATGPSFNCRSARTRGEIAVCADNNLANLDRQMASQFNRAVSAADPGKRLQLQRSRGRFLRFRDSCKSDECMAGAYRERMREIDDIMNERWSPR